MIYQLAIDWRSLNDEGYCYALYKYGEKVAAGRSSDIDSIKDLIEVFIHKVHVLPTEKANDWILNHYVFPENIKDFDAKK